MKHPTLDFGSGHDLMVHGIEPHIGRYTDGVESAWNSLFPSLSAPPQLTHVPTFLFLKINKKTPKYKNKTLWF